MHKRSKVKNKSSSVIQITAEQLLLEAKERDLELLPPPPKQRISTPSELADYQLQKREQFETDIRKNRTLILNWIRYAHWEESQKELQRARSIYERALEVDHRNVTIWLKYAEMEMKHRQVNHARNVLDRGVATLPRANQLWYKYVYMEQMLGNVSGVRQVFERWMEWQPCAEPWQAYINFELRHDEVGRVREIYERLVVVHPEVKHWIKYAEFEENRGFVRCARAVYERAVHFFGEHPETQKLYLAFARFEQDQKEYDRASVIYKYALGDEVHKAYIQFLKQRGDRASADEAVVAKRRLEYEHELSLDPTNYDAWFDYLKLLEDGGNVGLVREAYTRAVRNVPPVESKHFWRRYIYLWIKYALFEELEGAECEKARQVYRSCLGVLPHGTFTFAKIWIMFAHFEVRGKNLKSARQILGTAIGKCPGHKLFKAYIDLETQLLEFERCRVLYGKYIQFAPHCSITWVKFAELEALLGDTDRARAVFELATRQPVLDMPELVWKGYIDFEILQGEFEHARGLYERLLEKSSHVQVWLSYAQFERSNGNFELSRSVYERANEGLRMKEARLVLLEAWKEFEETYGDEGSVERVVGRMPKRVKKKRELVDRDGNEQGWEEVLDYEFPEDREWNGKILDRAKAWKRQQENSS